MENDKILTKQSRRGRPTEYSIDDLKVKLREIALTTNEKLNYSKLQDITGIERRNWVKLRGLIDCLNNGLDGLHSEVVKDLLLPNIAETFDQYYGKSKNKLIEVFKSYNHYINILWNKSISYDKLVEEHKFNLSEKDREINRLKSEIDSLKQDVKFYKTKYESICAESSYSEKRKELGIKDNVIGIKKGDMSVMCIFRHIRTAIPVLSGQ